MRSVTLARASLTMYPTTLAGHCCICSGVSGGISSVTLTTPAPIFEQMVLVLLMSPEVSFASTLPTSRLFGKLLLRRGRRQVFPLLRLFP
jgi:hypothetical protein